MSCFNMHFLIACFFLIERTVPTAVLSKGAKAILRALSVDQPRCGVTVKGSPDCKSRQAAKAVDGMKVL